MQDINLRGIIPAIVTPMTDEGELDLPALRRYVQWLAEQGPVALAVNVDTGEGPHLTVDEKRQTVRVNICGEEYPVTAPAKADYIHHLADYVDKKMREVTARTQSKQPARIAVLAALNIAHELFSERREKDLQLSSVEGKAEELLVWMDQKLAEDLEAPQPKS